VARKGHRANGKLDPYAAHDDNWRENRGFRALMHEKKADSEVDGLTNSRKMRERRRTYAAWSACGRHPEFGHSAG
jgi:hypothetical protein